MKKKENRVTASDVAKLAGVSKWTVSRAFMPGASISQDARERVMKVAQDLGYRPNLLARSLAKKKTHIIGVVIDEMKNPHTLMLLDEATRQLQSRGHMALIINMSADAHHQSVMSQADQLQVDGILFLGTILSAELISLAEKIYRVPLIQVCRNTTSEGIEVIAIDGMKAGKQVAELMLSQKLSRFGYMQGPITPTSHTLRKEGFEAGLKTAGHKIDVMLKAGSYEREAAWNVLRDYIAETPAEQRIEALFCENDILALGVMAARQVLAPDWSLSIVGFDDIEEAGALNWQLTTFSQRIDRLVNEALNRLIDGQVSDNANWQEGELRVRRSHLKA